MFYCSLLTKMCTVLIRNSLMAMVQVLFIVLAVACILQVSGSPMPGSEEDNRYVEREVKAYIFSIIIMI